MADDNSVFFHDVDPTCPLCHEPFQIYSVGFSSAGGFRVLGHCENCNEPIEFYSTTGEMLKLTKQLDKVKKFKESGLTGADFQNEVDQTISYLDQEKKEDGA